MLHCCFFKEKRRKKHTSNEASVSDDRCRVKRASKCTNSTKLSMTSRKHVDLHKIRQHIFVSLWNSIRKCVRPGETIIWWMVLSSYVEFMALHCWFLSKTVFHPIGHKFFFLFCRTVKKKKYLSGHKNNIKFDDI